MFKNKLLTIILIMFLGGIIYIAINVFGQSKVAGLVSSNFQQIIKIKPTPPPSSVPQTPSYNPPKELHYGPGTDLQGELDSVAPEISDSDFKSLQDLTGSLKSP